MKVGGKRRLFIPWQLAYGARGHLTGDPKNPGIPAKADLIFDIELVDVADLPVPPNHPGMGAMPGRSGMTGISGTPVTAHPITGGDVQKPAVPAAPATPPPAPAPATPAAPAQPPTK
jgi:peptidylprolyl isomerase